MNQNTIPCTNFHDIKRAAMSLLNTGSKNSEFAKLFLESAQLGIYRNIKYLLPIMVSNKWFNQINEALCLAARHAHTEIMELLLNNRADLSYNDEKPLKEAIAGGHIEPVELLCSLGANVHVGNDRLLVACCKAGDYLEIVEVLVKYGINIITWYQEALIICFDKKYTNITPYLIQYSATIQSPQTFDFEDTLEQNSDEKN